MMDGLVVDVSVAVKWFLDEEFAKSARSVRHLSTSLHIPEFFLLEFGHVLSEKVRIGEILAGDALQFVCAIRQLPMQRHPDTAVFPYALEMSLAYRIGLYDCLYLALAVRLDCPFITADKRLVRRFRDTELDGLILWVEDASAA